MEGRGLRVVVPEPYRIFALQGQVWGRELLAQASKGGAQGAGTQLALPSEGQQDCRREKCLKSHA